MPSQSALVWVVIYVVEILSGRCQVVDLRQVEVSKGLGSYIADGNADAEARKGAMAVQQGAHQWHDRRCCQDVLQHGEEDVVIDGEKVATHVQLHAITCRSQLLQDSQQLECRVAIAHARPAGVGVVWDGCMDARSYDLVDGLVDDAVPKGRSEDFALFWVADEKGPIGTPRVGVAEQLLSDFEEIAGHVQQELLVALATPLAAAAVVQGCPEIA